MGESEKGGLNGKIRRCLAIGKSKGKNGFRRFKYDSITSNKRRQKGTRISNEKESWKSIKNKLETEGSVWYVWWMDGVRKFMREEKKLKKVV